MCPTSCGCLRECMMNTHGVHVPAIRDRKIIPHQPAIVRGLVNECHVKEATKLGWQKLIERHFDSSAPCKGKQAQSNSKYQCLPAK